MAALIIYQTKLRVIPTSELVFTTGKKIELIIRSINVSSKT